jgi:hypothetical protein
MEGRPRQFFKTVGKSRLKKSIRHPIVVAIFLVGVARKAHPDVCKCCPKGRRQESAMRRLVIVFLLLFAVSRTSDAFGADRGTHLAQGTQTVTGCMVGCGTQVGSCQSTCLAISSGVATTSVTIVGATTDPTQCYLNCTSQQLLCEQGCNAQH